MDDEVKDSLIRGLELTIETRIALRCSPLSNGMLSASAW
jgi:hypothetical protein